MYCGITSIGWYTAYKVDTMPGFPLLTLIMPYGLAFNGLLVYTISSVSTIWYSATLSPAKDRPWNAIWFTIPNSPETERTSLLSYFNALFLSVFSMR